MKVNEFLIKRKHPGLDAFFFGIFGYLLVTCFISGLISLTGGFLS
ncbi:hypothetical protein AAHB55_16945 [Bacillus cereus]